MYPLGEIVEVLTVAIPLQALVEWLASIAFFERFANPEAACRRMAAPSLVTEAADPPAAHIVTAKSPKHSMHLIDQLYCAASIVLIACPLEQLEEVADREGVGPKVSLLILRSRR
jgi:hypothetical protein